MPYFIASATKANLRQAMSERVPGDPAIGERQGDWWPLTTSGAGNAGGTTAVFASLTGKPTSSVDNLYLLLTSGTNAGEWRPITSFDPSGGTITVARAYTAQVASSVTAELHFIAPYRYTLAGNEAAMKCYPAVYRVVEGHFIPNWDDGYLGVPRNMRDVLRIRRGGDKSVRDWFDRADSTTAVGNSWTNTTGVWGISSERLYSADDADLDLVTRDVSLRNGYIRAIVRGTLNSGSAYRSPALCFRIMEDRTEAIPAASSRSYLLVRILNAVVDLRKVDVGTESSLATATQTSADGTDYQVEVQFEGSIVRVWVDDVLLISYELLGLNLKYLDYPRVGVRLDKGGSPATAARVDNYYAYSLTPLAEISNWRQTGDRVALEMDSVGYEHLYHIEGRQLLTAGASDATFEAITSDGTAVYEIQTTDPAWNVLADTGVSILLRTPETMALAEMTRRRLAQPRPLAGFRHP